MRVSGVCLLGRIAQIVQHCYSYYYLKWDCLCTVQVPCGIIVVWNVTLKLKPTESSTFNIINKL